MCISPGLQTHISIQHDFQVKPTFKISINRPKNKWLIIISEAADDVTNWILWPFQLKHPFCCGKLKPIVCQIMLK